MRAVTLLMGACGITLGFAIAGAMAAADAVESVRPVGSVRLVGVLHDNSALKLPHDVELQGNLAFVPGKGGSLAFIDVSNPAAPRVVASMSDPVLLNEAETVLPMGDVLFLGARDFFAIDIRDPARPEILKKISDRPRIDLVNGMALRGTHVLSANKSGFISLFDVRNPRDPVYGGSLNTKDNGGPKKPHDVAVLGDHAIIVDAERGMTASVFVYRIADANTHQMLSPDKWTREAQISNTSDQDLQGANRVAVWNRFVSVGAFVQDRIGIIDLADPLKPRQVANMPVCDIDATGMTVSGRVVFVSGGECVEAIDVSNPADPVSIAQYRGGRLFPTRRSWARGRPRYDNGHDLVYRDGYLYVTSQNDNRLGILQVVDRKLLDLAKPQEKKN